MNDSLYIAWKYISFYRIITATLVACITLILFLPVALELLLRESERQLMSRAKSTPFLVGAKGSALDLVMNSLYFGNHIPELITMEASLRIADSEMAKPIPIYARFRARGYPIIGTTLDYFEFRGLELSLGRNMAILGECILGATVAEKLNLTPQSALVSSPENVFDLAGIYPLKMKVTGILKRSHTSDDLAIFVDLKTAWAIEGLLHGHEDLSEAADPQVILKKEKGNIVGSPKVFQYMEISEKNLESFHLHAITAELPITSVIAIPRDDKSGTILQGRYLANNESSQIVSPQEVIDGLLQSIFRMKNVLDAVILVVTFGMVLAIILVFALSLRLRQNEVTTIFRLGCQRMTIARLLSAEIAIIVAMSLLSCTTLLFILDRYSNDLVRGLFIR